MPGFRSVREILNADAGEPRALGDLDLSLYREFERLFPFDNSPARSQIGLDLLKSASPDKSGLHYELFSPTNSPHPGRANSGSDSAVSSHVQVAYQSPLQAAAAPPHAAAQQPPLCNTEVSPRVAAAVQQNASVLFPSLEAPGWYSGFTHERDLLAPPDIPPPPLNNNNDPKSPLQLALEAERSRTRLKLRVRSGTNSVSSGFDSAADDFGNNGIDADFDTVDIKQLMMRMQVTNICTVT